jgi:hypothetical protein
LVPQEDGPNQIPSINDADAGGNVGIGAVDPSGRGTVRCDGRGGLSICGMSAKYVGSVPMLPKVALPAKNL